MGPPSKRGPEAVRNLPLAVSMGDPAGIGLEISLKAWAARGDERLAAFALFADPDVVAWRARMLGLDVPVAVIGMAAEAAQAFGGALPVRPIGVAARPRPGVPDPANAPAVIAAIEAATAAVVRGEAAALVTNPIAKHVLAQADFPYPGHTEFLAALAEQQFPGTRVHPVMMLAAPGLRVVPLTVHCALADVPAAITRGLICETVRTTYAALKRDFGVNTPRIAVTGLNPHAGEAGGMGREEIEVIAPAIASLRAEGLSVTGPHAADTLFHERARATYDAAVCMYHDQALIPIKTIAFDDGVNVTLGLPFVRTSPDHGTAFDIAAEGRASAQSFIESLKLATSIAAARAAADPA
jgi:4-hydroxythreonine-4-phosphate dehydrogenase